MFIFMTTAMTRCPPNPSPQPWQTCGYVGGGHGVSCLAESLGRVQMLSHGGKSLHLINPWMFGKHWCGGGMWGSSVCHNAFHLGGNIDADTGKGDCSSSSSSSSQRFLRFRNGCHDVIVTAVIAEVVLWEIKFVFSLVYILFWNFLLVCVILQHNKYIAVSGHIVP